MSVPSSSPPQPAAGRRVLLVLLVGLLAWALVAALPALAAGDGTAAAASSRSQGTGSPFEGRSLYVDPHSSARRAAAEARDRGDEEAASRLDRIGDHAQADWLGDWLPTDEVREVVAERTGAITEAGGLPVYVLYAIPGRDCGSYSGGGLASADDYLAWVDQVAAGLGDRAAAVVLEPDSLAQLDCLDDARRAERLDVLRDAVTELTRSGAVAVYLDGGHSSWHPAGEMAERLEAAGVTAARGFALNVSNFRATENELAYGDDLAERLGGVGFVVDTSRNGAGPHPRDEWCNPEGRALGSAPRTTDTGSRRADAWLWIKRPGESDGDCGRGEPAAGQWWQDHALDLAAAGEPGDDPPGDEAPDPPSEDSSSGPSGRDGIRAPEHAGACPADLPPAGFADTRGSVHEHRIDCLRWWGITAGVEPGRFAPRDDVDRAQIATFLHRMLRTTGLLPDDVGPRSFADVPRGHTHRPGVEALAGLGVIHGTGGGRFAPDDAATRGQMASLLVRLHEEVVGRRVAPSGQAFPDIAGSPHEDNIRRLVALGVTSGHADGTFRPGQPVTREQMATFVVRHLDRLVADGLAEPPG